MTGAENQFLELADVSRNLDVIECGIGFRSVKQSSTLRNRIGFRTYLFMEVPPGPKQSHSSSSSFKISIGIRLNSFNSRYRRRF